MSVDIATYVHDLAVAAKAASASLATASDEQRQEAVRAMAAALRNGVDSIVAANELDMSAARDAGTSAGLLDRLLLTPERVEGMAAGLEKLAELPDPVGRVLDHRVLASGVDLTRVSVPLGLVAMVYEARPNVTADAGFVEGDDYVAATEEDWGREYLALEMSVKVVASEDEAIAHINRYGTMHSEAVVAEDTDACERFLDAVDASAVYSNASTRFTDGGEFGLGAEIGISTQKLHARGPFAAEALTTYKYKLRGTGQVRP